VRLYAALFAIGVVVYGVLAGSRLAHQSGAPHFVYQADAWLHGSISIAPPLPNDDWAVVETVELADGTEVSGRRMVTKHAFHTLAGDELPSCLPPTPNVNRCSSPTSRVVASKGYTHYVSFPAFPSVLMIPSALFGGRGGNDVIPTVLIAGLILPLTLLLLRRLRDAKLSDRTERENLWLVALLAFGSVLLFSAVQGKVWYTAHVVGIVLALIYAWASIEARRPWIAGLALGAAALTRTSMAFMFPLFLAEAWRMTAEAGDRSARLRVLRGPLLRFAIPIVGFAIAGMIYNYARFHSLTEFGHSYLALGNHSPVRQQNQIETHGLASYHYLARNLSVVFTLLPDLLSRAPYIQVSGHGLALWITTPALLLLVWPREKNALHRPLWITTLLVALPALLYMNSGWVQFGYRFSLDYIVFLVMLLAIGGRPMTRVFKGLIVVGIIVNLFGAWTFDREWKYYKLDAKAYSSVIPN